MIIRTYSQQNACRLSVCVTVGLSIIALCYSSRWIAGQQTLGVQLDRVKIVSLQYLRSYPNGDTLTRYVEQARGGICSFTRCKNGGYSLSLEYGGNFSVPMKCSDGSPFLVLQSPG